MDDRTDLVRGREALGVVKVIGPAMTVLLVVFAVFDAATHPDQFWWRVPTDVVPAIVLAAILWWQRRGHVTPQNAGWYVTVGSLVVSSSILVTVVFGGQVPIMIYLLIMTMVNGACALTVRQLVLAQTVPVLGPLVAMVSVGGLITSDSFADWIALWLVTLAASIAVFVSRERGFREMARIEELLEQQAIEDPVTGLGTRRALEQMFPVVRSAAEVAGLEVFLVFVDVDGLKTVNDALGHDEGDRVILAVAKAMREAARSRDVPRALGRRRVRRPRDRRRGGGRADGDLHRPAGHGPQPAGGGVVGHRLAGVVDHAPLRLRARGPRRGSRLGHVPPSSRRARPSRVGRGRDAGCGLSVSAPGEQVSRPRRRRRPARSPRG
ncbi:MAG: diguanylate cyclase [Candidatus Nanopelagicales bacterium]